MAAGRRRGAEGIDGYDAACLVLAHLYERWSKTGFTLNDKGGDEVVKQWIGVSVEGVVTSADPEREAAELREQMKAAAEAKKAAKATE